MPAADLRSRLLSALARPGPASSDFDLNPGTVPSEGRKLRPAAVLIALTEAEEVILTKRSPQLKHHPGQVAFPGGKQDAVDATLVEAALREAEEEVGLRSDQVEMLGALPVHETVTGFEVTPFIGLVQGPFDPVPEAGEVAEVFSVPLDFVSNPSHFRVEGRRWRGQRRHYYTAPYGPYYIWGATARMLRGLAERMAG